MTSGPVLLVDAGNSRIKWCLVFEGQKNIGAPIELSESLSGSLDRCWSSLDAPQFCALSCVAGEQVERQIRTWLDSRWSIAPYLAQSVESEWGVRSGYRQPERLGVDRWLALIGAARRYGGPLMVADLGTAISVDLLDAENRHQGGYLLPGRRLMCASLERGTAGVRVDLNGMGSDTAPGSCTEDALSAGISLALIAALERIQDQSQARFGERPKLILTGGDAVWMQARLVRPSLVDEGLLFEGLWSQFKDQGRAVIHALEFDQGSHRAPC